MSTKQFLGAAVVAAAGLAILGGSAVATVPDDQGDLIPEGVYQTREITRDELIATGVAAGFDEADVEAFVSADGVEQTIVVGLRLVDGFWDILQSFDGDPVGIGWHGTYEVVDTDTVIANDPEGNCTITYDYAFDGDQLTLDMVDDPCAPGELDEQIAQTIYLESAPFVFEEPAVLTTEPAADTDAGASTYASTTFAIPFEVSLPDWVPPGTEPFPERPKFVTWEVAEPTRALRFLAPVRVIQPPDATETEVPEDYADYLLSMTEYGATVEDVVETTVDGRPATIVTATTPHSIDGSLGCEEPVAGECWGLIPDAILRMAVIDTEDGTLLVWQRDPLEAGEVDYASFDAMLASLRFPEGVVPATGPVAATTAATTPPSDSTPEGARIPDGTYLRIVTRAEGEALGLDDEFLDAAFGADGEGRVEFEIAGDRWLQYSTNDAGIREIGDLGTTSYDADGRWVMVSESTGCPGCTGVVDWTYDDGTLTLSFAPIEGQEEVPLDVRLVVEGTYQRAQEADTIPDGRYNRTVTEVDGQALGLDPGLLTEVLGVDGELQVTIEFAGGRWTQYATNDAGITEIGTAGDYRYNDEGNLVLDEDCCPGESRVAWTIAGDVLTLTPLLEGIPADVDPVDILIGRLLFEGDFVLEGDSVPATEPDPTVTLRFANPLDFAPPQIVAFAEEVEHLSDGTIEFEWLPAYGVDRVADGAYSDVEQAIIADLGDTTVDIGWVGTRSLPGFEALLAPMLVDSHDLQQRVFEAGIPERMLADLDEPGLVGITVLPGPLRRIMGVDHPFATPADFTGQTIAGDYTALNQATMAALGATSTRGASGLPLDAVDAVLAHFQAIVGNGYHTQADSVAANVNLWPRPLAIIMSAESFDALTPEQQEVLLNAGANAVGAAMDGSRAEDAEHAAQLCEEPSTIDVIQASDAALAEFAAALQPVYDDLANDPTTAAYLDEIQALKDELGAPPDTLVCPDE